MRSFICILIPSSVSTVPEYLPNSWCTSLKMIPRLVLATRSLNGTKSIFNRFSESVNFHGCIKSFASYLKFTCESFWIFPFRTRQFSVAADKSRKPHPRLSPTVRPSSINPEALAQFQKLLYSHTPHPQSSDPTQVAGDKLSR